MTRSKKGRAVAVRLAPEPMDEAMIWLLQDERFWSAGLDRLAARAVAQAAETAASRIQTGTP